MVKSKTKILVVLLLIALIISIAGTSRAADYTCKVTLVANNNGEVKQGESITLLVKVTDIEAGEGIASFNAMLEYDSDVFDCTVSGDDDGEWQRQGLVENSLSMTRSDLVANSSDQTVAKIVLKAKTDASVGKQTFKLTKVEFSTGNETFSVADVSASITVTESTSGGNGENNNNNNNSGNSNGENNNNNGSNGSGTTGNGSNGSTSGGSGSTGNGSTGSGSSGSGSTSTGSGSIANPSSSNSSIPKTGITDVLIVGVILGTIAAVIFYIKYKRTY